MLRSVALVAASAPVLGLGLMACGATADHQATSARTAVTVASPAPSGTASTPADDLYNGVSQSALAACIVKGAEDCAQTVSGLSACVQARLPCNRSITEMLNAQRTTALRSAGPPLTPTTASALAVSLSTQPAVATVVSVVSEPFSTLSVNGESFSAAEPPDASVFVLLVDGPNRTDGGPGLAPRDVSQFGVVVDAASHQVLETCIGGPCVS